VTADLNNFGTALGKVSVTIVVIIDVLPTPSKKYKSFNAPTVSQKQNSDVVIIGHTIYIYL
jgi:hypothetical protein